MAVAKLYVGTFGGVISEIFEKYQSYQRYVKPFHASYISGLDR
jgi:hypothetical protein